MRLNINQEALNFILPPKPYLFLSSSFHHFQPWKVVSQITSQDLIYFSQPGSFCCLRILIPIALGIIQHCWIHRNFPQLRLSFSESQGWLFIIINMYLLARNNMEHVIRYNICAAGFLFRQHSILCRGENKEKKERSSFKVWVLHIYIKSTTDLKFILT